MIGCYLIRHHDFTAAEAIGLMRIIRPGSVLGPQQHFLERVEKCWWAGNMPTPFPPLGRRVSWWDELAASIPPEVREEMHDKCSPAPTVARTSSCGPSGGRLGWWEGSTGRGGKGGGGGGWEGGASGGALGGDWLTMTGSNHSRLSVLSAADTLPTPTPAFDSWRDAIQKGIDPQWPSESPSPPPGGEEQGGDGLGLECLGLVAHSPWWPGKKGDEKLAEKMAEQVKRGQSQRLRRLIEEAGRPPAAKQDSPMSSPVASPLVGCFGASNTSLYGKHDSPLPSPAAFDAPWVDRAPLESLLGASSPLAELLAPGGECVGGVGCGRRVSV